MTPIMLLAQAETQVAHYFARLHTMSAWWQWFAMVAFSLLLLLYVGWLYRRDSVELPRGLACGLFLLRCLALAGILFYFLDLEKREERRLVRNSRAHLLVDTSLSMGIQDEKGSSGSGPGARRIDRVIEELGQGEILQALRQNHDVVVHRFGQEPTPEEVLVLPRVPREDQDADDATPSLAASVREARRIALGAGVLLAISLLAFAVYAIWGRNATPQRTPQAQADESEQPDGSWSLLVGMVLLIAAVVVLGVASLRYPELKLSTIVGLEPASPQVATLPDDQAAASEEDVQARVQETLSKISWQDALAPRGAATRLGDALRFLVNKERGGPLAGVVLISDGGNNAGSDYQEAVAAARAAGVPVYCVGLGSDRRPTNIRVADLEAPPRVYPGDKFQLTGYIQSFGLGGRSISVELLSKVTTESKELVREDEQQVTLGPDGELIPVRFEITPTEAGTRSYTIRATVPSQDADARDNEKSATVQIVERKNRVLLMAGGATREYQFLRNMLYRERDTSVDVLLQSGTPGISQEANELLFEVPDLAEELFEYDCIIAIDFDWTAIDESQADLLERWVAEKAGGLILIAGPVQTPKLIGSSDRKLDTIRGLYPVAFFSRGSATLSLSRTSAETPWPITFTREGEEAEFMQLEDELGSSQNVWSSHPGIYGYFAVKDAKPGATVLARFSDPNTSSDGDLPVYIASQFYGAGRVVYQGSGEMWRLRQVGDAYFERYYTKLIRWVSQGRLLRDSTRGLLLVDKDRCLLGDTVSVQAVLTDAQHEPLTDPEVVAVLIHPDGRRTNLTLRQVQDAARPGAYRAQFTAELEGDYRLELALAGGSTSEVLSREVRARIPTLETERPERNDALLKDLANKTDGAYFVGLDAATSGSGAAALVKLVEPADQVTYLPGTPDKEFDRTLMTWLMGVICGALSLEWLIRRLSKLA